jgi:hypothetical protein
MANLKSRKIFLLFGAVGLALAISIGGYAWVNKKEIVKVIRSASVTCTTSTSEANTNSEIAVADFVGHQLPPAKWTSDGGDWLTYIPGVGAFTTDCSGKTIVTATFDTVDAAVGQTLDESLLLEKASAFAALHVPDMTTLFKYSDTEIDHGSGLERSLTWREKRGSAWFPKFVEVGIKMDGVIDGFSYNPITIGSINVRPTISASTAKAIVLKAHPSIQLKAPPELDVVGDSSDAQLVWVMTGDEPSYMDVNLVDYSVDAQTGSLQ